MSRIVARPTLHAALEELADELLNFDSGYQAILTDLTPNSDPHWLAKRTNKMLSDRPQLIKDFEGALQREWDAWIGQSP